MMTKQIILYEAGKLFKEKGFQNTSTREIAEKSEVTQPNLYYHFKTKEEIYIAVLEDLSSQVKVALERIIEEEDGDLLESLLRILNYLRDKHPANFSIMSHDMTYEISKENHYHLYRVWQEGYIKPLARLFSRYMKEGSVFTAEELSHYFYSLIAPFMQKDNDFHKVVTSEKIIYLFVYGILDRNEEE